MPSWLTLRLAASVIGALAVIGLIYAAVSHYRGLVDERDGLQAWQDNIISVTSREAGIEDDDGNPALLGPDQVARQITFMGEGIERLRLAIAGQNADAEHRANDLEERLARAERDAARLQRDAERGQALIDRLRAGATEPGNEQCMVDDPAFLDDIGDL